MSQIDPPTLKRVVFAKKLYHEAIQRLQIATELDRMIAVHQLDNAIEMVLKCIPTFFKESISRNQERDYANFWQTIDSILSKHKKPTLPLKQDISRLRDARDNGIQHYGTVVDTSTVQQFSTYVESFLRSVTQDIFGINFDELFMSALISNVKIKPYMEESEKSLARDDFANSMKSSAKAFAVAHLEARKTRPYSKKYTDFFGVLGHVTFQQNPRIDGISDFSRLVQDEINDKVIKPMNDFAERIDEELEIIRIGVDYNLYTKFKAISPLTLFTLNSEEPMVHEAKAENYNKANAVFCYNFVLDTILKLQATGALP